MTNFPYPLEWNLYRYMTLKKLDTLFKQNLPV